MSKLTKHQTRTYGPRPIEGYGNHTLIVAIVRHDDECGNGHNSFAITGEIFTPRAGQRRGIIACGCLHGDIARVFPELVPYLKWHLTSTDEPMHYVENTMYWLGWRGWADGKAGSPPNLDHARNTAVWPDMPESFLAPQFQDFRLKRNHALGAHIEEALRERLPQLKADFRAAVESLGLEY